MYNYITNFHFIMLPHCIVHQSRSQDFAKGGFFLKLETIERTWLILSSVLSQIETFFWPKSGDLQKKKKEGFSAQNQVIPPPKKGLHVHWDPLLLVDIISGSSPTLTPISFGGAIFVFRAKIGLKTAKNMLFRILFRPMGELEHHLPPPPH